MSKKKPLVVIYVGPPACGKTTMADMLVRESGFIKLELDDLRKEYGECLTSREWYETLQKFPRKMVTAIRAGIWSIRDDRLIDLIKKKQNVVISDTNVARFQRDHVRRVAIRNGAQVMIQVVGDCVDLDGLLERNATRHNWVQESVIRDMHALFVKEFNRIQNDAFVWGFRADKLAWDEDPRFFVFDIDGTLADMDGQRGPFDWKKVGLDKPREIVCRRARDLIESGMHVEFWSGRDGSAEQLSLEWLQKYVHPIIKADQLYTREAGCFDPDYVVKYRIYNDRCKALKKRPCLVHDDRQQVVDFWTNAGIPVWQVEQMDR